MQLHQNRAVDALDEGVPSAPRRQPLAEFERQHWQARRGNDKYRARAATVTACMRFELFGVLLLLTLRYCMQCRNLANPAMHDAGKWPAIVERRVLRVQGRGNIGKLMAEMMTGVAAALPVETRRLVADLRKHARKGNGGAQSAQPAAHRLLESARFPSGARPCFTTSCCAADASSTPPRT